MSLITNALLFGNNRAWGHIPDPPIYEVPEDELTLEIGDWIKCKDRKTMLNTMHDLIIDGIETEFCHYRHGEKGLWLKVIAIDN